MVIPSGRLLRLLLSVVLAFVTSLLALPTADACACGGVFTQPNSSTTVPTEDVLITHVDDRTSVTMRLHLETDASDAGLVVPTPNPATASLADEDTFLALGRATTPQTKERWHLVGGNRGDASGDGAAPPSAASTGAGVQELSSVDLGPLRATTLRAGDPEALRTWLRTRGYSVKPAVEPVLDTYVRRGWSFVAMQLTPAGRKLGGQTPPITLSYADREFVYPMLMSSAASGRPSVRTYVLSDHRVKRTDRSVANLQTTFAADLRKRSGYVTAPIRDAAAKSPYLTLLDQQFDQPSTQIVSDFTFARADNDDPVVPVHYVDRYLFTPGEFVVVLVLLTLLVTGISWFVVHRRRPRSAGGSVRDSAR